jgi:hypothetical protein
MGDSTEQLGDSDALDAKVREAVRLRLYFDNGHQEPSDQEIEDTYRILRAAHGDNLTPVLVDSVLKKDASQKNDRYMALVRIEQFLKENKFPSGEAEVGKLYNFIKAHYGGSASCEQVLRYIDDENERIALANHKSGPILKALDAARDAFIGLIWRKKQ